MSTKNPIVPGTALQETAPQWPVADHQVEDQRARLLVEQV